MFRLSARRNFYISPMKSSPFRMPASASGLTWCVHGGVFRLSARLNFYISPVKSSPFRMPASASGLTWCVHGGVFRLSARRNFYISYEEFPVQDASVCQWPHLVCSWWCV